MGSFISHQHPGNTTDVWEALSVISQWHPGHMTDVQEPLAVISQWHPDITDVQDALAAFTGSSLEPVPSDCRTYKNRDTENNTITTTTTHKNKDTENNTTTTKTHKNRGTENNTTTKTQKN